MSVNKFKILQDDINKYLNIPVEMTWDFTGRDQAIEEYEKTILNEVIGQPKDFEVLRFSHKPNLQAFTDINYEFNFFDNTVPVLIATPLNWASTYLNTGFNVQDIYYYTKPFTKSFFKLDFYDTPNEPTQKNYFTVIIPVQQGLSQTELLSTFVPPVDIRIPTFKLDFIGDKEGFFLYWLRERNYIDINTFYMSAKFFDARTGVFVRMTNRLQTLILPNEFTFDNSNYFYYEVTLDYPSFTYKVNDVISNIEVGNATQPIKWYEYVNP